MRETFITGTGQELDYVHPRDRCAGRACVVHNPSRHHMRSWPTHWRRDRAIMERICPCGVGHPDPDDVAFLRAVHWADAAYWVDVHGCCGCCDPGRHPAFLSEWAPAW